MGSNGEIFNIAIAILKKIGILTRLQKLLLIFGAPIIFSLTAHLVIFALLWQLTTFQGQCHLFIQYIDIHCKKYDPFKNSIIHLYST